MTEPLWAPSPERARGAQLTAFRERIARSTGEELPDTPALWRWSIDRIPEFWTAVWDFCEVRAETRGAAVLENPEAMPGARFFPEARLNFAENLLRRTDDAPALLFFREDGEKRSLSFAGLRGLVARLQAALSKAGVQAGDRVAGYMPNAPETVAAMLAATSLGAVWSSCSPDFGTAGVVDRFGQIDPKVLFTVDGYRYGGKAHMSSERLPEILAQLPTVTHAVIVPFLDGTDRDPPVPGALSWDAFIADHPAGEPCFTPLPFDHPLYVMFSSGTTGKPKCIVHGAGGTLLQHLKEHRLHCDVRRDDRVFYFTTCGWMMWNWLVTALAAEATLVLYDGNPFHPDPMALWRMAEQAEVTLFGTAAKYLEALAKAHAEPSKAELGPLRTLTSTGSPLAPELFDWVYAHVKQDLQLSSISGGTDIVSCFVLGDPTGPVYRGEIQTRGLGMAVEVWDEEGRPIVGTPGELVCTKPFPSMPVGFWNDEDGARYRAAYFERFPGVWCHGDWVELTERGGMIIYGRSDATLNPGGVRIGTAEIYRQVEKLEEILESIVIGQDHRNDVRVVLFVKLRPGQELDAALVDRIRSTIRANTTPRHVPAKILDVPDIPRTKSGKITEIAVRHVVHGRPVKNKEALANPEALEHFADRPELRD